MRVTREFDKLGNALTNFGYSVSDAFRGLFKDPVTHAENLRDLTHARNEARLAAQESLAEVARIRQESMIAVEESRGLSGLLKKGAGKLAGMGVWVVEQPVALAMKPVRWTVSGGTKLFTHFPKAAPVGVVLGAAAAGGTWLANRESKMLRMQGEAIQQMQLAQAQAAQPRYMNSASQADVDARIAADRAQGVAGASTSRADAIMASRQQAAPATADVSAF